MNLYKNLPASPGVYLMKNKKGKLLYVGKAANLRRRVASYFLRSGDLKTEKLAAEIKKIDYQKTQTSLEALILEAELIKRHKPPYNIKDKDDKSFLYVEITRDEFPRVLLVRGKSRSRGQRFGPFTSASSVREALKILRRIFPWSVHPAEKLGKFSRPCFDSELGLCPGVCVGRADKKSYLANISHLKLFLQGKKKQILKNLKKEMALASQRLEFEKAEKIKRRIFSLNHIQDIALVREPEPPNAKYPLLNTRRIEGYDVSNISGTLATGAMAVFRGNEPDRGEYRRFKIRTVFKSDDLAMLEEILRRRFNNPWPLPDLVLVDGGLAQAKAAKRVLDELGLKIPVLGLAKGKKRKENRLVGRLPRDIDKRILIRLRDEAHRFAVNYHRQLRNANLMEKQN